MHEVITIALGIVLALAIVAIGVLIIGYVFKWYFIKQVSGFGPLARLWWKIRRDDN